MKRLLTCATLLLALVTAPRASAGAILYSTTDLGTSSQIEKDASGHIYGLANASGSVIYAFDKVPVTFLNVQSYIDGGYLKVLTMQNGDYRVGYISGEAPGTGPSEYPTFMGAFAGWFFRGSAALSPVSDINARGQVVGMSLFSLDQTKTYAAFSDNRLLPHDAYADASVKDNINNYIKAIPGVSLISAGLIDDLGRIVATGDNGHGYLLTPTELGPAATVPEPPAWMMLALAGGLLAARSTCRRREGR